ncbi:MAG: multifunctional oxoglutarate decarboxylase/oxoglutarate dehydrogenase thiamine pyrophosphate-binding subunit/dihydrolipoyllysine-residue succinyltransferase subunit, partial [Candidatus Eremiobacteraeota bacterium]|nr:multifunctional oxoglutarate decarboxylase/oxoglutarate dehydrogenase thiamine pyrophosphate-binding subunit/dihydrolipoyllysine-residue succinyltransferase subunit [Candidatus Eremiobacteraeota bacterium]
PLSATPGRASHRAQRLAEREHLDLRTVAGTGPGGLILHADVLMAAAKWSEHAAKASGNGLANGAPAAPVSLPPIGQGSTLVPLKGPAAALVGAMEQSLSIPTATSFRTLQVGTLESRRSELNLALKGAGSSEKISFTHLIAFALVRAARELPAIVASFRREHGAPTRVESGIHLGIAVDTQRKDGSRFLVVPVVKRADALDFAAFRAAYEELIAKARENKLVADDMSGASFTLTNPGGIGTVASVPRLTAGQGAILAAGAIAYPPGFARANEAALKTLGVEKIMTLTSTYDHRVIQGAQSGEYLKRVDDLLAGKDDFYDAVFASFKLDMTRAGGVASDVAPQRSAQAAIAPAGAVTDLPVTPPREFENYSNELLRAVAAGMAILSAYRRHGHLVATLDPLGTLPPADPALDWHSYGLTPSVMSAIPASILRTKVNGATLADVVGELRKTYSSTIAYEVEHIANIEQREWLRDYIEVGAHSVRLAADRARNVLQRLTKVETFERYLRKTYIGQKTFSIEGLDVMVPMLEEIITLLGDDGVRTAVLGMAHRGRLATIAHVVNRPYEEILAEFEAADRRGEGVSDDATGDVKYHHGASGSYLLSGDRSVNVALANNPSHLEAVDGVVEGRTRALQTDHESPQATLDVGCAAPILIHGDAAFSAQGVVAEVLNLQALDGYKTGGTIHIISNNQIGFTTDPLDARSTRYASDLAKGFDVPIVHVNADDVDACIAAVHLAIDFRRRFGHDVIIDLIGYRRFGHNETDEPAYTQPDMYERIKTHPTVRELYAQKLIAQGVLTAEDANGLVAAATARLTAALQNVKSGKWQGQTGPHVTSGYTGLATLETKVAAEKLLAWNDELVVVPGGFTIHPKLVRQLERRKATFANDGEVDWGLGEALAFASLVTEGTPIRLTGQDTQRGTFSHRHLVYHDAKTDATFAPIQHLAGARASFEIYNSPLSEYACLGFEYGYAVETPNALVLWEAQFGDFNNGAQIIIDQFIAAGQAKWGETSRLVLLLPHGYEGAGPEHSSARIERFLQLSAEGNVQVANCSNAAQYFHLLRLQALQPRALPLVIFTPKSLLRMKAAAGRMDELSRGKFAPVIDEERFADRREAVERVLLCSGKIYYDLTSHPGYAKLEKTAIVRVELLSPLPTSMIVDTLASYPNLRKAIWVQEEPKNMGARAHVRRRLIENLQAGFTDIGYIGRPYRASPSEGYGGAHAVEQERIVREALTE